MAVVEPDPARPKVEPDERWEPKPHPREELVRAVLAGGMSGVVSHPLDNVLWKIGLLCEGDNRSQFGLSGVCDLSEAEVLRLVSEASGWTPDPNSRFGPFRVAAERVLAECERVGDRPGLACERGERKNLPTRHPPRPPLP